MSTDVPSFFGFVPTSTVSSVLFCVGCKIKLQDTGSVFIHKKGCKWMRSIRALMDDELDPEPTPFLFPPEYRNFKSEGHTYCCSSKCVRKPDLVTDGRKRCGCCSWCSCACVLKNIPSSGSSSSSFDNDGTEMNNEVWCCLKRCIRRPSCLIDGKFKCGCWSWCRCACESKKKKKLFSFSS